MTFRYIGLLPLFNDIYTFVGHLISKLFLQKSNKDTIKPLAEKMRGIHTFPKSICPKVNVRAQLEFELAYFEAAIQYFSHYTFRYINILFTQPLRQDMTQGQFLSGV